MPNSSPTTTPETPVKENWQLKIYPAVFVLYGIALCLQLISAWAANFHDAPSTDINVDALEGIVTYAYIPAIVLYFCRCKAFAVLLAAAYSYDIWFHLNYAGYINRFDKYISDTPVFFLSVLLMLFIGIFYKGFRVNFYPKPKK